MPTYLSDGYSEKAFLRGVPKLHGALRFTFRPVLAENRADFVERNGRLDAREQTRKAAELIKGQLVEWDLRTPKGEVVPVSTDAILRLHPRLLDRLLWVVTGVEPWDDDDGMPAADAAQLDADRREAVKTDTPFGDVRAARDAKN
jgi:hypothetical protein